MIKIYRRIFFMQKQFYWCASFVYLRWFWIRHRQNLFQFQLKLAIGMIIKFKINLMGMMFRLVFLFPINSFYYIKAFSQYLFAVWFQKLLFCMPFVWNVLSILIFVWISQTTMFYQWFYLTLTLTTDDINNWIFK